MKYINILTGLPHALYRPHINHQIIDGLFDIRENSREDLDWDCVAVSQNVIGEVDFKCRAGNVFYFCGEPPLMEPCPRAFTNQFDIVVAPHPKVRHQHLLLSHGYLNWSFFYTNKAKMQMLDYSQLAALEPEKTKFVSLVISNKTLMPGHNKRLAVAERLKKDYVGLIDIYGRGINPIENKADALIPYRFHICMENSFIPDYWTEKFSDPILAQSVPIYAGCTNIEKYFGNEGYFTFDINDYDSLRRILDHILEDPEKAYKQKKDALEILRHRLMEEQNIIPFLINFLNNKPEEGDIKEYHIKPLEYSIQYKMDKYKIRAQRLVERTYFNLFKK